MEANTPEPSSSPYDVKVALELPLRERVQVLLLRVGRTQNWLAEQCDVSHGCMSQIVNEKWKPSSRIMVCMAEALDCDSVVLFGEDKYWKSWNEKIGYEEVEK